MRITRVMLFTAIVTLLAACSTTAEVVRVTETHPDGTVVQTTELLKLADAVVEKCGVPTSTVDDLAMLDGIDPTALTPALAQALVILDAFMPLIQQRMANDMKLSEMRYDIYLSLVQIMDTC